VLTRQGAIPVLDSILAVPATRTVRGIATEVLLDRADGMPDECALSLDSVVTLPKAFFRDRIAKLSAERMHEVCRALAIASGCA
jgi:mRNA interferase MazF